MKPRVCCSSDWAVFMTRKAITPGPPRGCRPPIVCRLPRGPRGGRSKTRLGTRNIIDRVIATFTPELIARGRGWGDPDPRPVFVVGLPRSGTTLIEQILASHPQVHGAGELPDLRNVFRSLPELAHMPWADSFDALNALDRATADRAARRYLEHLDRLAPPGAARVVDKMPDNIEMLGSDRVTLAERPRDCLPPRPTRRRDFLLADPVCIDPLGQRLRAARGEIRELSANSAPLEDDKASRVARSFI